MGRFYNLTLMETEAVKESLENYLEDIHDCGYEMWPADDEEEYMSEEGVAIEATVRMLYEEVADELRWRKGTGTDHTALDT